MPLNPKKCPANDLRVFCINHSYLLGIIQTPGSLEATGGGRAGVERGLNLEIRELIETGRLVGVAQARLRCSSFIGRGGRYAIYDDFRRSIDWTAILLMTTIVLHVVAGVLLIPCILERLGW